VLEVLGELELPRELNVAYLTVLSYYYDRKMRDDRSCIWGMYVVQRVQLTAIALLADLAGERVFASPQPFSTGWSATGWMTWRRGVPTSTPGCSGCSKAWRSCSSNGETWCRRRACRSGKRRCRRRRTTRRTHTGFD